MSTCANSGYEADGHRIARPSINHPDPRHWNLIRIAALMRDRHACRTCWRTESDGYALECHHRHYDNWGAENLEDVVILCVRCHDLHTSDVRLARYAASSVAQVRATFGLPETYVPCLRKEIELAPHHKSQVVFVPVCPRSVIDSSKEG